MVDIRTRGAFMEGSKLVRWMSFAGAGLLIVLALVVLGLLSRLGERKAELKVALQELETPENIPMFPLGAFSPEGYFALTYENALADPPYAGYGGFQIYLPSAEGYSLIPSLIVPLPGEDWAKAPFASIGGVTLFWDGDRLALGPDLDGPLLGPDRTRIRLHVSREGDFELGGSVFRIVQLGLPDQVDVGV
jgi:hypothetical protein